MTARGRRRVQGPSADPGSTVVGQKARAIYRTKPGPVVRSASRWRTDRKPERAGPREQKAVAEVATDGHQKNRSWLIPRMMIYE